VCVCVCVFFLLSYLVCSQQIRLNYFLDDRHFDKMAKRKKPRAAAAAA
jgi:hypothetical protein